jgi:hypothetical protein
MLNLDHPINITNGPKGLMQIDSVTLFGINLGQAAHRDLRLQLAVGDVVLLPVPVPWWWSAS